jgi:hypothetical protein
MKHSVVSMGFMIACSGHGSQTANVDAPGATVDPHWFDSTTIGELASDSQALYFVDGTAIKKRSLDGGDPAVLFRATDPNLLSLGRLAVDGSDLVFVASYLDSATLESTHTLSIVPTAGGAVRDLVTSHDSRAFLGVSLSGSDVYYSEFTSLLRVPRTGGTSDFRAQSPGTTQYWIYSPVVVADQVYWATDGNVYRIAISGQGGTGTPFATLAGSGKLVSAALPFVAALSPSSDFSQPASAFTEIAEDGTASAPVNLGAPVNDLTATATDVWAASQQRGILRAHRGQTTVEVLDPMPCMHAVATDHAVFVSTQTGIARHPV